MSVVPVTAPAIVATTDRVAKLIREEFHGILTSHAGGDPEIDIPRDWGVYCHITWESGWSGNVALPAVFVHTAHRGLHIDPESGKAKSCGPDINVGFAIRAHRDRIEAAARLGSYVGEVLWSLALNAGFHPHFHSMSTFGQAQSTDWGVAGTILFGLVDGAPGEWL